MPVETTPEHARAEAPKLLNGRPKLSAAFLTVTLALLVRLELMIATHGINFGFGEKYTYYFQNETTNISASIANGYGYVWPFTGLLFGDPKAGPTSWIAPVYPYFCAAVFRAFGVFSRESFFFIVLVQCFLSALTCIPILKIAEKTVGRRAGIVAAFVWALFPWFSQWAITYIWEITLSALLVSLLFWYALRLEKATTWRPWVGFGALWGFALLVNPSLGTILAASLLYLAYYRHRIRLAWLRPALLTVVMCALVISPWLIRNRVVFGEFAFLRTDFWFEFWNSNYHGSPGRDWVGRHPTGSDTERAEYLRVGELAYVREKAVPAKKFVKDHPGEFVWLCAKRFVTFWDGSTMKYFAPAAPWWFSWSFPIFSLLLLPSLILVCVRRIHAWQLFAGAILLYPVPYYITSTQVRYRHAIEPLMLLVMAFALLASIDFFRSRARTAGESES